MEQALERIKSIKGLKNDKDIAPLLGMSPQDFSNRKRRGTLRPLIAEWAAMEGINVSWILTGEGEKPGVDMIIPNFKDPLARGTEIVEEGSGPVLPPKAVPTRAIPVLGRVPAGFPSQCPEEIIEYISLPNVPEGAYALIVHGESMAPTIRSGDYVIFIPGSDLVKNGDVVIVNNEWGESMCKRYREREGERLLTSDNAEYPPVKPNGNYRILGRVIKVWRDIEF